MIHPQNAQKMFKTQKDVKLLVVVKVVLVELVKDVRLLVVVRDVLGRVVVTGMVVTTYPFNRSTCGSVTKLALRGVKTLTSFVYFKI